MTTATQASTLGVKIIPLKVYAAGPQKPPCVIDDPVRGRVELLTAADEPFRSHFEMKVGQMRGRAYHSVGSVCFDLLSGSYVFMTSDEKVQKVETSMVNAPAQIKIPAGRSHVFIPLTDGIIIETADAPTEEFLANVIRVFDAFAPHVEAVQKDIAAGKYRLYAQKGMPTDLQK